MRYAVFSDIHGNLPALQAVLRDAEGQGCDGYLCVGDIVGEYNRPNECIELLRQLGALCVKGNQDEYRSTEGSLDGFKAEAQEAIQAGRRMLTNESKSWLNSLPLVARFDGFTLVHSSLNHPERWEYVFEKNSASPSLRLQEMPICFYGHTHVPVCFMADATVRAGTFKEIEFRRGSKYMLNSGAVGQPRGGVVESSYVVFDAEQRNARLRRLPFQRPAGDSPMISAV